MSTHFQSSRDVIIRTEAWAEATMFYGSVLGLPVIYKSETMIGFETGSFCLYVEKGQAHGPVFEYLVPDLQAAKKQLLASGCIIVEEDKTVPRCYIQDPYGIVFNVAESRNP